MKARYCFLMHCLDDKFEGPETIHLDQFEADVTFEKDVKRGPGRLRVHIDLPVSPDDICFDKRGDKGWQIPPRSMEEIIQRVANFVGDVLQVQTKFGQIEDSQGNTEFHDNFYDHSFFEYLPESAEEEERVKDTLRFCSTTLTISHRVYAGDLIELKEFPKLAQHPDAVANIAEASRLKYAISKYRELYRVIEYFFARPKGTKKIQGTKKRGKSKVLERASNYLIQFDEKYKEGFLKTLADLRDRCSHTAKDYITPNNVDGLRQLEARIPDLQAIAKILLDTPPE